MIKIENLSKVFRTEEVETTASSSARRGIPCLHAKNIRNLFDNILQSFYVLYKKNLYMQAVKEQIAVPIIMGTRKETAVQP